MNSQVHLMDSMAAPHRSIQSDFVALMLIGSVLLSACSPTKSAISDRTSGDSLSNGIATAIQFREVRSAALEAVRYHNGSSDGLNSILEIVGGGVACVDFDLDGNCDLIFAGGGEIDAKLRMVSGVPSTLLRNRGDWKWENVTQVSELHSASLYTNGVSAADFDNDGFDDVLFYGYCGVLLFRNQGDGTFVDTTSEAGLSVPTWITAVAWTDFDDDGVLDLHLVSYVEWSFETHNACVSKSGHPDVCSPTEFDASPDSSFRNNGYGTFLDCSSSFSGDGQGRGLGVLAARFDSIGPLAVYVANDLSPNNFYVRNAGGNFVDLGMTNGVAVDSRGDPNGSMGVALIDFNLDRRFDIFVTNFEHEDLALYQNEGSEIFRHVSRETQLNRIDVRVVGFGVVAADFDHDGDEDILLTSGHVNYHPPSGTISQLPLVLENVNHEQFRRSKLECEYLSETHIGRGVAAADFDNDGDVDVVITHLDASPVLLENTAPKNHYWIQLRLVGTKSARSALGAIAEIKLTSNGEKMVRQIYGGGSYLSQSAPGLVFGWKDVGSMDLEINWNSGAKTRLSDIAPNQKLTVIEP